MSQEENVLIPSSHIHLDGRLHIPNNPKGLVLFVHGSGSSRFSSRNLFVASILNKAKLATLLFDLLTPEEDAIDEYTREFRFNIPLLATRLLDARSWCKQQKLLNPLPFGYFGASTGAGAALLAAAKEPEGIKAIVSRGGRPDLAGSFLSQVKAPTLFIVGENDPVVIQLNQTVHEQITCYSELEVVPGATHLFEEPGTLEEVARLAKSWFSHYLTSTGL